MVKRKFALLWAGHGENILVYGGAFQFLDFTPIPSLLLLAKQQILEYS